MPQTPQQKEIVRLIRACMEARAKAHQEAERIFWTGIAKVRDNGILSLREIGDILGMTTEGMRHNFIKHDVARGVDARWKTRRPHA